MGPASGGSVQAPARQKAENPAGQDSFFAHGRLKELCQQADGRPAQRAGEVTFPARSRTGGILFTELHAAYFNEETGKEKGDGDGKSGVH